MTSVAIIGAGFAGLACAAQLSEIAGLTVRLFDKGRGPGGRAATRRVGEGLQFDHGVRFLEPESAEFQAVLDRWTAEGRVAPWTGRFGHLTPEGFRADGRAAVGRVGVPKMSAVLAADGVDIAFERQVTALHPGASGWILALESGEEEGPFDRVVVAIPAPQAVPLLAPAPDLQRPVAQIAYESVWAGLAAFAAPLDIPFDGVEVTQAGLAWIGRESSKPQRPATEALVCHASPDWTRRHLESDRHDVAPLLLDELRQCLARADADLPEPDSMAAHRWRYALVSRPLGEPALWDRRFGLGYCSDGCLGPTAGHAWRSGDALGRLIRQSG